MVKTRRAGPSTPARHCPGCRSWPRRRFHHRRRPESPFPTTARCRSPRREAAVPQRPAAVVLLAPGDVDDALAVHGDGRPPHVHTGAGHVHRRQPRLAVEVPELDLVAVAGRLQFLERPGLDALLHQRPAGRVRDRRHPVGAVPAAGQGGVVVLGGRAGQPHFRLLPFDRHLAVEFHFRRADLEIGRLDRDRPRPGGERERGGRRRFKLDADGRASVERPMPMPPCAATVRALNVLPLTSAFAPPRIKVTLTIRPSESWTVPLQSVGCSSFMPTRNSTDETSGFMGIGWPATG